MMFLQQRRYGGDGFAAGEDQVKRNHGSLPFMGRANRNRNPGNVESRTGMTKRNCVLKLCLLVCLMMLVTQYAMMNYAFSRQWSRDRMANEGIRRGDHEGNALTTSTTPAKRNESDDTFVPKFFQRKQYSAVDDIEPILKSCTKNQMERNFQELLYAAVDNKCTAPATKEDFICSAQCHSFEPELERTFEILKMSNYSAAYLYKLCTHQVIPAIFRIKDGKLTSYRCIEKIHGRNNWVEANRLMLMLSCAIKLPDFVYAFDHIDYAFPQSKNPYGSVGYVEPQNGIIRFVRTDAHPVAIWPTPSYVAGAGHCAIRQDGHPRQWYKLCFYHEDGNSMIPWEERSNEIFWRGAITGAFYDAEFEFFMPRAALLKKIKEANMSGFDVGYTGKAGITKSMRENHFAEKVLFKPSVHKVNFPRYRYHLHLDGNGPSWGLMYKLEVESAVIWHTSPVSYREFYYIFLKPWEHYIPLRRDFSNLWDIREWLSTDEGIEEARRIVQRTKKLINTRLRVQDMWCYITRLMYTMSEQMEASPTDEVLIAAGFDLSRFQPLDDQKYF